MDDIVYYLTECDYIQYLWTDFCNWWSQTTGVGFQLQTQEKLFSVANFCNDELLHVLNYMLVLLNGTFTSAKQMRSISILRTVY